MTTSNLQRQRLLKHSELPAHQKKVERAEFYIREALQQCHKLYVSVSGGKDSTAVLALVGRITDQFRKIHHDDEFCLLETQEYLGGINDLEVLRTEAKHTDWFVTNKGFNELAELDCDLVFMGLRAEENSYRRKNLGKYGAIHQTKSGVIHCNPIAWWSVEDVWAFILANNIRYNRAYDVMSAFSIPIEKQRIGPFANEKGLGHGQLQMLKRCFPADFNRFVKQYPKARAYV